jgi:hypothetical protein
MQEHEKNLLMLAAIGAVIGMGKLLVSDEHLTLRLILGRSVLGSATAMVAGVALIQIPDMPPLALLGIGCALGITGAQFLEAWFKKKLRQSLGDKK